MPWQLRKVATACEDFGHRKQLSVFLCRLSATDVQFLFLAEEPT
jgi:CRISPR-associated protein Cas2